MSERLCPHGIEWRVIAACPICKAELEALGAPLWDTSTRGVARIKRRMTGGVQSEKGRQR